MAKFEELEAVKSFPDFFFLGGGTKTGQSRRMDPPPFSLCTSCFDGSKPAPLQMLLCEGFQSLSTILVLRSMIGCGYGGLFRIRPVCAVRVGGKR